MIIVVFSISAALTGGTRATLVRERNADVALLYGLSADAQLHVGFLEAFEPRTGRIVRTMRLPYPGAPPDLAVSTDGQRIYVIEEKAVDGRLIDSSLSLIDARSWKAVRRASLQNRTLYDIPGPSNMALSTDGRTLAIFSYKVLGGDRAAYWLAFRDAHTLRDLVTKVSLPECGGASLLTLRSSIAVMCPDGNAVYFIDPKKRRLVSKVNLPSRSEYTPIGTPVAIASDEGKTSVYVVANDLRIVRIDAVRHRITGRISEWRGTPQTVPSLRAVGVVGHGEWLGVGQTKRANDKYAKFTIYCFRLPAVRLGPTLSFPHYTQFVTPGTGALYIFATADAPFQWQNTAHFSAGACVTEIVPLRSRLPLLQVAPS